MINNNDDDDVSAAVQRMNRQFPAKETNECLMKQICFGSPLKDRHDLTRKRWKGGKDPQREMHGKDIHGNAQSRIL